MDATRFFSRRSLGLFAATVAVVAGSWLSAPSAYAEPKQDPAAHQQLCADLYLLYDANMDIYYDHSNSDAVRQQAYENAQAALSDFRKQGCKVSALSRTQQVQSLGPIVNVNDAALDAGRSEAPLSPPRTAQLIRAE